MNTRSFVKNQSISINPSEIKYTNLKLLQKYITEQGKILPRRITRLSAKDHRSLTRAVKQARILGLLPFLGQVG